MDGTVNVKSRTEYYDSDKILSKWGFTDSQCHHCGILNSDLNGLLMQCATCKKAYYCSMKVRQLFKVLAHSKRQTDWTCYSLNCHYSKFQHCRLADHSLVVFDTPVFQRGTPSPSKVLQNKGNYQ